MCGKEGRLFTELKGWRDIVVWLVGWAGKVEGDRFEG